MHLSTSRSSLLPQQQHTLLSDKITRSGDQQCYANQAQNSWLCFATTAVNIAILLVDLSLSSKAAVANMDYGALVKDADFKKAVQSILEACSVNMNLAQIRC